MEETNLNQKSEYKKDSIKKKIVNFIIIVSFITGLICTTTIVILKILSFNKIN